jgi:molecular chaperone GrpE
MDEDQNKTQTNPTDNIPIDLQKIADDYLDNWKRERADFQNYKKDEARRVEAIVKYSNEGLALEIIDVLDGLEIAMNQVPQEIKEKHPSWLEGITNAINKFQTVLGKYDIKRIDMQDAKFNPGFHEALEIEPGGERIEEIRAGYMLGDKVFRPTRVKIVK